MKFVIFEHGEVIGRIYAVPTPFRALDFAEKVFPEATDLSVVQWEYATKQERKKSKARLNVNECLVGKLSR